MKTFCKCFNVSIYFYDAVSFTTHIGFTVSTVARCYLSFISFRQPTETRSSAIVDKPRDAVCSYVTVCVYEILDSELRRPPRPFKVIAFRQITYSNFLFVFYCKSCKVYEIFSPVCQLTAYMMTDDLQRFVQTRQ